MISFETFTLPNGLRVVHHFDGKTPLAVVNILYNVGARDENPNLTGMAHLFEHLMFGGSKNAETYDEPLQQASGENNAFTSNDITNYYVTLPAENLETALWLESDRMFQLNLTPKTLEVQQGVVSEEFKQRYLNQPYGDLWLHFRPLAYSTHPYQWATIGKNLEHIEKVTLEDALQFYRTHYNPSNAILVVAGNVSLDTCKNLVTKWFGDIPGGNANANRYPVEPEQLEPKRLFLEKDVPMTSLSLGFHCASRKHVSFHTLDLLGDLLGGSASSRLYQKLVKEERLFADIGAYSTESLDAGLFIISGRIFPGVKQEQAEAAIWEVIQEIIEKEPSSFEWEKVLNKKLTVLKYSELDVLNKAMNLALFTHLGDTHQINKEEEAYRSTSPKGIQELAQQLFRQNNCSTLIYSAKA
ncbi:MAG: insulinase family protein [Bacteroidota bacterium]|nr:insulinase family protein [Bacteroidota bacterium]MDX5431003.1 insulinase family protein [Bacteroidota bacterium]MDX5469754.1 insulinase family protein [Bacteroidota bacterium]